MLKSEQTKAEMARLSSLAREARASLDEKMATAVALQKRTKTAVSRAFQQQRDAIEGARQRGIQEATGIFSTECAELKALIEAQKGLTYASWTDPLWHTFNVEVERAAFDLTRVGKFRAHGNNASFEMPAMLSILGGKNVVLRATGVGKSKAREIMRNVAFRLLASLPPGKLRFVFIDPVELGSTAAGLVGVLPDFLTNGIAWHQERDIEEQLSLMETRIAAIKTKCLGIQFTSLDLYNADSKTKIKEPYWLVVVSDCPVRFTDTALQKLLSIANNGRKAGVYLVIMLDDNHKKCTDRLITELTEAAHQIVCPDDSPAFFDDQDYQGLEQCFDEPPSPQLISKITAQVSSIASSAQCVRIDWEPPTFENYWKGDARSGLKIPLGVYGARETQFFEIDEKLLSSALVIGKPGSGKSRLLHVLVSCFATQYSPQEVALYLLDCKQVEFKDYASHRLPHARVIAIESEREFGLSVVRKLNAELDLRKTLFSSAGETSLSSYRNKTGRELPRIILVIDEFQELLYDDALGREVAIILDRLVRLGRALGINLILSSQTLSGQTTLLASTKNQIPIRIVLQSSQSDSTAALSQDNDEARLLERPGEAIYNSANGRREGNNRFQVSWLSDEKLESVLNDLTTHAAASGSAPTEQPIIFDGNSMPDLYQNRALNEVAKTRIGSGSKRHTFAWLGEPIEIKPSTAAVFKRQSRSNLLIIGQNEYEQSCASMMLASIVSVAVQRPPEAAQFLILDLLDSDVVSPELLNEIRHSFPHKMKLIDKSQIAEKLKQLLTAIESRAADSSVSAASEVFLCILGLHRERSLRPLDPAFSASRLGVTSAGKELSNAEQLLKICREGPVFGIHCLIWCDTFSNFQRIFQRNGVEEFSLRVALQMTESDSRSLIDSDAANRLGIHRAILVDEERQGRLEKFRPYSLMTPEWIKEVGRRSA